MLEMNNSCDKSFAFIRWV